MIENYIDIYNKELNEKEIIESMMHIVSIYRTYAKNGTLVFDNDNEIKNVLYHIINAINNNEKLKYNFIVGMKYILAYIENSNIDISEFLLFNIYISYLYDNKYQENDLIRMQTFEFLCKEVIDNYNYNIFSYYLFKIMDIIYIYNKNLEDIKESVVVKSLNETNEYWDKIKKDKTIIWN